MAWSSPMTATANAVFTAAQFNAYVRDNLNETAPAKASTDCQIFVSTGANAIAARVPTLATVGTQETTSSTSYGDLATPGPSATVTTGRWAFVIWIARMANTSAGVTAEVSYEISGATTQSALINNASFAQLGSGNVSRFSGWDVPLLNPGSNTFTLKYRTGAAGTATFIDRKIFVLPF
jgi:hypothetical protein